MDHDHIADTLRRALRDIAPDVDLDTLDPAADLMEDADLDSMDFLHLVEAVDEKLGVAVPERDYWQVRTLGGFIGYLEPRVA